ncbi:MAG: NADPH-dependent glutamate synthase [Candidatus Neomarinimicrobiota bacterium]
MAEFLPVKERTKIPRQNMPEQDALARSQNFEEVNLGLTREQAILDAQRCLQCKKPTCMEGCPVEVDIFEFLQLVVQEDFLGAAKKIKEDNVLPAICGRVCPQETQCEAQCKIAKNFGAVSIGRLERFVADYEMAQGVFPEPPKVAKTGKKVAIVGSGPAGLSCAGDLVNMGYDVTVFEALHELGGVLVYGIPEFRLPKEIVRKEVDNMRKMGVKFETNVVIGATYTIDELMQEEGFSAVFVGVGAGLPWFMNIPGENLAGVYSANEFLTRVNLMKAYKFPDYDSPILDCAGRNVAVFGGGNVAMDAVRTAKRLGAKSASIYYRRSEAEMPARTEEIHHAKDEGVIFEILTTPIELIGDDQQRLHSMKCLRMELGEPDASGRRRPVPIEGSEYAVPVDIAIVSIGNGSNPLISQTTPDIKTNKWGDIIADEDSMKTTKTGVFAGGDIVTGGATVILAMGAGRKAARGIHEYLTSENW